MTAPATKKPTVDKPEETTPTPSEIVDQTIDREELRKELLADLPPLRPAHRFRLSHRNAFRNLSLDALKMGVFDRDNMDYDLSKPEDIEAFQKLQRFVETIDEWAESIAENKDEYATWAEGKDEETFMALFSTYQADLGESNGSEN